MTFVPTNRLISSAALLFLPLSVIAAQIPSLSPGAILVMAVFLAVILIDLLVSLDRLHGIDVQLPPLIRLAKGRPAHIEFQIQNQQSAPISDGPKSISSPSFPLRIGLPLPPQIHSDSSDFFTRLPPTTEYSRVKAPCRALERGRYFLNHCYLETPSRLGFWGIRSSRNTSCELRVYPDLLSERKNLAAVFLNRANLGRHAQRQIGQGREFEKLREYIAGDSFDEVHWKATAKRGHPVTKVFQIERTQEVYVIIDASRLSGRLIVDPSAIPPTPARPTPPAMLPNPGTSPSPAPPLQSSLERYLSAALILGLAAEQQGDLFGLLVFSNKIDRFLRAKNGRAHYNSCREAIYSLQPRLVNPDFDEVSTFIRLRLRRRALLIFLTALDDPILADSFVQNAELIRRQHLVLVHMLNPPGVQPLFSQSPVNTLDDLYAQLGGHMLWTHLKEVEKKLQRQGIRLSLVQNARLSAQIVSDYLNVKRRQLL